MKNILSFIMASIILLSLSDCKNPHGPDIEPKAILTIRLETEPVVFYYFYGWYCSNGIIISEINGVGGHIDGGLLEFLYEGAIYESKNYEGKGFNAYESWTIHDTIYPKYTGYNQARVTITGKDDNGHNIKVVKIFSVYWDE